MPMPPWIPAGHTSIALLRDGLRPGDIIALDSDATRFIPWVVIDAASDVDGTYSLIIEQHLGEATGKRKRLHFAFPRWPDRRVWKLPEHYAICRCCQQLPPCQQVYTDAIYQQSQANAARYETAGVCPACQEVVTDRQRSFLFATNLYVPLGPQVVFHARQRCRSVAIRYDEHLAQREGRQPALSCSGLLVHHWAKPASCTNDNCPGEGADHGRFDATCTQTPCETCRAVTVPGDDHDRS